MYIQSYPELESVVKQYVIQRVARRVCFDISDYVIAPKYGRMLEDVIVNNINFGQHEKIVNPRPDHYPRPVVLVTV